MEVLSHSDVCTNGQLLKYSGVYLHGSLCEQLCYDSHLHREHQSFRGGLLVAKQLILIQRLVFLCCS